MLPYTRNIIFVSPHASDIPAMLCSLPNHLAVPRCLSDMCIISNTRLAPTLVGKGLPRRFIIQTQHSLVTLYMRESGLHWKLSSYREATSN